MATSYSRLKVTVPVSTLVVWSVAWLLHLGCALLLWKRGLVKHYFSFFLLLLFQLVSALVLNPLSYLQAQDKAYYKAYFYSFWTAETVSIILITVIFYQVFSHAFADYETLKKLTTLLYLAITAGCLTLAIIAAAAAPATDKYPLTTALLSFTFSMQVLRVGTMVAFFILVLVLALPLRSLAVGLTLGFGLEAGMSLILTALRQHYGHAFAPWYNSLITVSYLIALIVFFAYLVAPKPELSGEQAVDQRSLRGWKEALSEFLQR